MDVLTGSAPRLAEPLPVELMNTVWSDREGLHDGLSTDEEVLTWLQYQLPRLNLSHQTEEWAWNEVGASEITGIGRQLRTLRDSLRWFAARETDDPRNWAGRETLDAPDAIKILNGAARAAAHWSEIRWGPGEVPRREVVTGASFAASVTGTIAEKAIELFSSDLRFDLRACLAPGCLLYFIRQHPRREWCSTTCGNRVRATRYYQRHKAGSPDIPAAPPAPPNS